MSSMRFAHKIDCAIGEHGITLCLCHTAQVGDVYSLVASIRAQGPYSGTAAGMPQYCRTVLTAAGYMMSILTQGNTPDTARMPHERPQEVTAGRIPQLDCSVLAAADQQPPIPAEGQTPDRASVPLQSAQQGAASGFPQSDCPVLTATDYQSPIATQRHTPDATDMPQ